MATQPDNLHVTSTAGTDKLLLDLSDLGDWLLHHALRHPDQQAADAAYIRTVGRAIGRIEGLSTNKQPDAVGQMLLALANRLTIQELRMSQLSDFAKTVKADFDAIGASVDGLVIDVKTLNDTITQLKASPEDQALMDAAVAQGQALVDKTAALDAQTAAPPTPPPAP